MAFKTADQRFYDKLIGLGYDAEDAARMVVENPDTRPAAAKARERTRVLEELACACLADESHAYAFGCQVQVSGLPAKVFRGRDGYWGSNQIRPDGVLEMRGTLVGVEFKRRRFDLLNNFRPVEYARVFDFVELVVAEEAIETLRSVVDLMPWWIGLSALDCYAGPGGTLRRMRKASRVHPIKSCRQTALRCFHRSINREIRSSAGAP